MSARREKWLDRLARRAAGSEFVPNPSQLDQPVRRPSLAPRLTRGQLLNGGSSRFAGVVTQTRLPQQPQPIAERPFSRGVALKALAAATLALGQLGLLQAPEARGSISDTSCEEDCGRAFARALVAAHNLCDSRFGSSFDSGLFLLGVLPVLEEMRIACFLSGWNQAEWNHMYCRDSCDRHRTPPPPKAIPKSATPPVPKSAGGCNCVDDDTCCPCINPATGVGFGMCCIYQDCRCCPS